MLADELDGARWWCETLARRLGKHEIARNGEPYLTRYYVSG